MAIGTIGGTKITLLNIYAPNEDGTDLFKNIVFFISRQNRGNHPDRWGLQLCLKTIYGQAPSRSKFSVQKINYSSGNDR